MQTSAAIESLLDVEARKGASQSSLNHLRAKLVTIFNRARKAGLWSGPNPAADIERRPEPKRAYATLTAEEVPELLAAVPDQWRNLFATAAYAGLRRGELFALRRADIDLDARTISARRSWDSDTTKGGHADTILMAPVLVPYLRDALSRSTNGLVFPDPDGAMRQPDSKLGAVLRRALARAGFVEGYDHVCRRCKAKGRPHVERHLDREQRRCPRCKMLLWPKAIPRPMRFHDMRRRRSFCARALTFTASSAS